MPGVLEAIDALRVALLNKGVESHLKDAFDNLASCLVLLNSSSPSVQVIQKIRTVVRQPFLPLYNACFQPALRLSSSILSTVLVKLRNAQNAEDERVRAEWDTTAEVILSGILDFLDQKDSSTHVEPDCAVWEVLYQIICEFFFLDSGRELPAFSIPLCLSAYSTLSETAARQVTIRNALRQRAVLGGERLGAAISGTRDYLLLEALLLLFARLLPPANNAQGKTRRSKFVKEVLGSPKLFKRNAELLDIMQKTSGLHWDDVAAQIIDVLSRSDITYPQPFAIDEIHVCGRVFPQPLATDRLIMDKQALLTNIVLENVDVCESLQMPYSRIRTITLDNSEGKAPKGKVLIIVHLTSPPLVTNIEMKSPDASHLYAKFLLRNDVVGRFMEALRRRGVGKLNFLNPLARVDRKRKSISIGTGLKFTNDSSPIPPTASFEDKVQHVNQVYKTGIEGTTAFQTVSVSRVVDPAPENENGLVPPTNEDSKLIQKRAPSCLPGDTDELSEISEFEVDTNNAFEPGATKAFASGDDKLQPIQNSINRVHERLNKSPEFTSKPASRTRGARPGTEKALLISYSPVFGATSSTQIDDSSESLSNDTGADLTMVATEAVGCSPVGPQNFVGAHILGKSGSDGCRPPDANPTTASALNPRVDLSSTFSGANQEIESSTEVTKDTRAPLKLAGRRRKRELDKSPGKPVIEVDDEHVPPSKRRRRLGEEDKVKYHDNGPPTPGAKKCTKTVKRLSPEATVVDFGDPAAQGARRSSRIKKRQTMAPGTRPSTPSKTQRAVSQSASDAEPRKSAVVSLQGADVEIGHLTQIITGSGPTPLARESSFQKTNAPSVELTTEDPSPVLVNPREMLKVNSIIARVPSQPSATPTKAPQKNIVLIQEAPSDSMQLNQEHSHAKNRESIHGRRSASDILSGDEVGQVQRAIECSLSLRERARPMEPSGPIMASTARKEIVTIDLTSDESPTQENSSKYEASVDRVRSTAEVQSKSRAPDLSDGITSEDPVCVPSSRHKRRSVTFASPIEYVLDRKISSKTQINPSSCQSPSPSESSTLSPLRIPTGIVNVKHESPGRSVSRITLHSSKSSQASVQDEIANEVGIHDIVEVLNEIQAVIVKGISDKFRNSRKGVQRSRDELVQQVLNELRSMIAENANYFNRLLSLEENYYKNCKAITRCWEDLINCNDELAVRFQNTLKEHDQNISAKTFPKSLLPMQPVFFHRGANA